SVDPQLPARVGRESVRRAGNARAVVPAALSRRTRLSTESRHVSDLVRDHRGIRGAALPRRGAAERRVRRRVDRPRAEETPAIAARANASDGTSDLLPPLPAVVPAPSHASAGNGGAVEEPDRIDAHRVAVDDHDGGLRGRRRRQLAGVARQRLVLFFGNLLVLSIALIPAALLFIPAWWVTHHYFAGSAFGLALLIMPSVALMSTEVWFGMKLLGAQIDRIDISNEMDSM